MEYTDISELDDKVQYIKVTWRKMINYASVFTKEFQAIEQEFASGKYGPEWPFARWLGAKCGMSRSVCYRIIAELHKVASDEQRDRTNNALAEMRRDKALLEADRRATQLAWNDWVDASKAAQDAWDKYQKEEALREKDDVKAGQDAWDQYWLEVKEDAVRSQTAWDEYRRGDVRREQKNKRDKRTRRIRDENKKKIKELEDAARFSPKSPKTEKPVPDLGLIEDAIERLVEMLHQLPAVDRLMCLERLCGRLQTMLAVAKTDDQNIVSFPTGSMQS